MIVLFFICNTNDTNGALFTYGEKMKLHIVQSKLTTNRNIFCASPRVFNFLGPDKEFQLPHSISIISLNNKST